MTDNGRIDGLAGPRQPRHSEDFDGLYTAGTPPWDIGRPQPAFAALLEAGRLAGKVLDVGCGTGEHALMAAAAGFDATGVDGAPTAITLAQRKAAERRLPVRFLVLNVLDLASLGERFDTTLDCGLFHVLDDTDRQGFERALRASVPAGGRYHMLCFSDLVPGDWGPRRIRQEEIREAFRDGWSVESIEAATIVTTLPTEVLGWHAEILRV